ncbi:MAG TPA: HAD family hydrolase [Planctomycetaceae bacterium]|nr:HAD family hydrolase [Planctomycetaceae bacterium]
MHVCLFDIDGTLINTAGAGKLAMETALQVAFGIADPTPARNIPFAGRTDRGIALDLFAEHGIPDTAANWQHFLATYLECLPRCLAARPGEVLPGVLELIAQLSRLEHVELALLTGNVREGALRKLGHFQLDRHFEWGGFGDEHPHRDDVARLAYAELTRRYPAPIDLERVWVIGDTPSDVLCGRAIGARVIAVATGMHTLDELRRSEPDHLFPNFADPSGILQLWK